MYKTTKEIGAVLRQKRMNQLLSLNDLSKILDIAKPLLQKYETGKRNISRNHFPIIVEYLEGRWDQEIMRDRLEGLRQKYEHLTGKRGLEFWE
ncbi:helix-turn-helix domain-containing protein [Bacillus cereus group sp. BfR-BA-02730]|uniref:helix-turn-helix domain-containing protein n=1 Tax=Bacillus cereus group sp. BfR-BA-02730 TaxID=3094893 RepID=UPI0029C368A1|nr:helix-turn-helix domain-containing protein [Bacillus cereus group sp. BfR-BA-02730]MDX5813384.1 helix-turn-helix domain-containing protein [Bacillus cereus group sp. BfR-BA-02730]